MSDYYCKSCGYFREVPDDYNDIKARCPECKAVNIVGSSPVLDIKDYIEISCECGFSGYVISLFDGKNVKCLDCKNRIRVDKNSRVVKGIANSAVFGNRILNKCYSNVLHVLRKIKPISEEIYLSKPFQKIYQPFYRFSVLVFCFAKDFWNTSNSVFHNGWDGKKDSKKKDAGEVVFNLYADHSKGRPTSINDTIVLMYAAIILGIFNSIYSYQETVEKVIVSSEGAISKSAEPVIFFGILFTFFVLIVFVELIKRGKVWARNLYLAFLVLGVPYSIFSTRISLNFDSIIFVLGLLIQIMVGILLFLKPSSEWFRNMSQISSLSKKSNDLKNIEIEVDEDKKNTARNRLEHGSLEFFNSSDSSNKSVSEKESRLSLDSKQSSEKLFEKSMINEEGLPEFDDLLSRFVKENSHYYLPKFKQFQRRDSYISWNWAAFFFTMFWFAYRKMYLYCFLIVVGNILTSFTINLVLWIVCGLFGNYIYYTHAKSKINNAKDVCSNNKDLIDIVTSSGGVSPGAVWALLIIVSLLIFFVLAAFMAAIVSLLNI